MNVFKSGDRVISKRTSRVFTVALVRDYADMDGQSDLIDAPLLAARRHRDGQQFSPIGDSGWYWSDDFEPVGRPGRTPLEQAAEDVINHPQHYKSASGIECIDVIESLGLGFAAGNAMKYLFRAGVKGGPEQEIEDLKKAAWYIQRRIQQLQLAEEGQ